jgi:hypothetical protein
MTDETEGIRRILVSEINSRLSPDAQQRYQELCQEYGEYDVFDTKAIEALFEVIGFMAPYVVVRRKFDGKKGSLMFSHSPRFYFGWQED